MRLVTPGPSTQSLPALTSDAAIEEEYTRYLDQGRALVASGKFDWALEELPRYGLPRAEDRHAAQIVMLVKNQLEKGGPREDAYLFGVRPVMEDIQTSDLSLPTKWSLPIIRRIYPAIFDSPLFATQSMPGPLAYAFFLDFKREFDSTDFRVVNPFTSFVAASTIVGATSITLKGTAQGAALGTGPFQIVAGQSVTFSLGTSNAETLIPSAVSVAAGITTLTIPAAAKAHTAGDVVYVAAVSALGEAAVPTKGKLSLSRTPVTANKWMMAATWSTEAMEDARAQLNLDVEAEMVNALSVEIGRELFGTIVSDILQGATGGAQSIPAIGSTSIGDYKTVVPQAIYKVEELVYSRRNHDCDTLLCGLDVAANIAMQDTFHIMPADKYSTLAQMGVTYLGTFQNKFSLFKSQFLPANLAIVFQQPTTWLQAGYVYMPYIPLSPMPLVYAGYNSGTGNYQNTDEWTRNIRTRAGRLLTVSDEYGILTQS